MVLIRILLGFYRQAYSATTDFAFYSGLHRQRPIYSAAYFLLLALHVSLLKLAYAAVFLLPHLNEFADWAAQTLPPMRFEQGKLSVAADLPAVYRYPGGSGLTLVFARSEQEPLPELLQPALILVEDTLYVGSVDGIPMPMEAIPWAGSLAAGDYPMLVKNLAWSYSIAGFLALLIWSLFTQALLASVFSLFGYSASSRYPIRLSFLGYFTLALYGLTPSIVIQLLGGALGLSGLLFQLVYMTAAAIYVFVGTGRAITSELPPPAS